MESNQVSIGPKVAVKGELTAGEDLTIDGRIDGTIQVRDHVVTIGPHAEIAADVTARIVVILGSVKGNATATEKVEIRTGGALEGDITAPRVALADGAHFRGRIDMGAPPAKPAQPPAGVQVAAPQVGAPQPVRPVAV
jgi:cytoskeletal protein CcmA (bactofilin family)